MPYNFLSIAVVLLLLISSSIDSQPGLVQPTPLKKDEAWVCVKWQRASSAIDSKVNCVEWAKKDCSNRLYPEICKKGG
jgi:hypothetical protein